MISVLGSHLFTHVSYFVRQLIHTVVLYDGLVFYWLFSLLSPMFQRQQINGAAGY